MCLTELRPVVLCDAYIFRGSPITTQSGRNSDFHGGTRRPTFELFDHEIKGHTHTTYRAKRKDFEKIQQKNRV